MIKFSGATDAGYVRVRGQLWLWVNAINKQTIVSQQADTSEQALNVRQGVCESKLSGDSPQPARRDERALEIGSSGTGAIMSGGGPIFTGNVSAGRDLNYNQR
jgi:hypothetical protein